MTRWKWNEMTEKQKSMVPGARPTETKANKYHAIRAGADADAFPELAGRTFDSRLERDRACELVLLQRAGEISDLFFQLWVNLAGVKYRPDFLYIQDNADIYEDCKGVETPRFRMIKQLWLEHGPCKLRVTVRNHGRIETKYELIPRETP